MKDYQSKLDTWYRKQHGKHPEPLQANTMSLDKRVVLCEYAKQLVKRLFTEAIEWDAQDFIAYADDFKAWMHTSL